jgi:hypothetical protein
MLCEHLSRYNEYLLPNDPSNILPIQNEECSFDHPCCEEHLWTYIKDNQLDKVHAFIWKINNDVFDPLQTNFDLKNEVGQTQKGILLESSYVGFSGFPPFYTFSTPFGAVHFPLTSIPMHKARRAFDKFVSEHVGSPQEEKAFSKFFSIKYTKNAEVEKLPLDQKKDVQLLTKMWNMLEVERTNTNSCEVIEQKSKPLSKSIISPNMVSCIQLELDKTIPYHHSQEYYQTVKYNKEDQSIKCFTNGQQRQYFISINDYSEISNSEEGKRYNLKDAKPAKFVFHNCKITLLDGRKTSASLNDMDIGILLKEIPPKVLISSGYETGSGLPLVGKVVNKKAEDILTLLFKPFNWCGYVRT